MEYLVLIGTIVGIHLLALISPGPDFIMLVKNSLTYSRKTGIYTAVGFALGIMVHIFYCLAGLAILISKSILVFNIIKLLGAGYLMYIGIMAIISKSSKLDIKKTKQKTDISPLKAIKIGFITNVLNPKATLFFLSLFTMIISPETPNFALGIAIFFMLINQFLWFALVAIFFTQKKVQNVFSKFHKIFDKILGGLLVALGLKIALTEK